MLKLIFVERRNTKQMRASELLFSDLDRLKY